MPACRRKCSSKLGLLEPGADRAQIVREPFRAIRGIDIAKPLAEWLKTAETANPSKTGALQPRLVAGSGNGRKRSGLRRQTQPSQRHFPAGHLQLIDDGHRYYRRRARPFMTGLPDVSNGNGLLTMTSAARAAYPSPAVGMHVHESDTGNDLVYQGPTTGWTPPWNTSWGEVAAGVTTTDQPGITATPVTVAGTSVTWTAIANRRYKVSYTLTVANGAAGAITEAFVTDGSGTFIGGDRSATAPSASAVTPLSTWYRESPTAGSVTRRIEVRASNTQGAVDGASQPGEILVEDIGPNGAPS